MKTKICLLALCLLTLSACATGLQHAREENPYKFINLGDRDVRLLFVVDAYGDKVTVRETLLLAGESTLYSMRENNGKKHLSPSKVIVSLFDAGPDIYQVSQADIRNGYVHTTKQILDRYVASKPVLAFLTAEDMNSKRDPAGDLHEIFYVVVKKGDVSVLSYKQYHEQHERLP